MFQERLEPKLITVLKEGYNKNLFFKDLSAGIIVGIVALPLAIAFAIASGVKPEQGLYTAIIAGFLISAFSGSRVQVGGPTGAFIVLIYSIVQQYGYNGLAIATIIAGAMLIIFGLVKLGTVIKFIPYPVTVGFTAGIALIIFTGQIKDLLGLQMNNVPAEFIEKIIAYSGAIYTINVFSAVIALTTILIVIFWPRFTHKVPGSLVAIIILTAIVQIFNLPVDTIGKRFGEVPGNFRTPAFPDLNWHLITQMFSPALSIALLAGIESLLSAVVADGMTGRKHRSDMELVAQGIANFVSPLFGGIPATGAIARTATNIKNGGKTPFAGIIHAITLLLIMLFFGKWAALIPMPVLAGILVIVAYNMSEYHLFVKLFRSPKSDVAVLLITFTLTVVIDLIVAIQVGVVLAALLFMRRMSDATEFRYVTNILKNEQEYSDLPSSENLNIPPGVEIFEVNGPFFFGAADKFKTTINQVQKKPKILVLRMRKVLSIDATGLRALEDVYKQTMKEGTQLVLSGVHAQPFVVMQRAGFLDIVGEENVHGNIDEALKRTRKILGIETLQ